MLYLIDGNNLMGRKRSRRELLALLAEFSVKRRAKVQVVFDGAPERDFPEGSAYKGVKIAYSKNNSDAETRIKEMVEKSRHPRELTIVTSDRALAGYARSCSAKHLSVNEFLDQMEIVREQSKSYNLDKPTEDGEVAEWLQYFAHRSSSDE